MCYSIDSMEDGRERKISDQKMWRQIFELIIDPSKKFLSLYTSNWRKAILTEIKIPKLN